MQQLARPAEIEPAGKILPSSRLNAATHEELDSFVRTGVDQGGTYP